MTKQNTPTAPKKTAAVSPTTAIAPEPLIWKRGFYVVFILFILITLSSGYNTGFHSDEMDMNAYGKANWKYFTSWGKDTSYRDVKLANGTKVPDIIKTYGGFFELINSAVTSIAGPFFGGEYNTRHLLCQLMGLLLILITGYICVNLYGRYIYGICGMILLFLSPTFFGHVLFNTKDIPFALGYTLCIYGILLLLKQKSRSSLNPFICISLGLAACIGTRIGGLVLVPYILVAFGIMLYDYYKKQGSHKSLFREQIFSLLLAVGGGFSLALLTWPFALSSPAKNIKYALDIATKFPQRIPFVFEGVYTDSLNIPSHYLFKWMSISIPVFVLLLFCISCVALFIYNRKRNNRYYILLLMSILFPILYAMQTKAALYSGWRHLLFIYPLLIVFSVYIFHLILHKTKSRYAPVMACGICVIGMTHPIYWSLKNHPYEYTYFNEISVGFAANYSKYENDYWQLSVREALDWLYKHEGIDQKKGTVIASNGYSATQYMVRHDFNDTNTTVRLCSYKSKCVVHWKYLILSNLFIDQYVMDNDFYPPINTIHTIEIDGKTVCAIIKDSIRTDYKAYQAMQKHALNEGDSLADLYLSKDPNCVKMLEISASAKAGKKDWDACYKRCATGIQYEPDNIVLRYYLGVYYANNGEPEKAIRNIEGALALGYNKTKTVYKLLSGEYNKLGNTKQAQYYAELGKEE